MEITSIAYYSKLYLVSLLMLVVNKRLCYGFSIQPTCTEVEVEFQSGAIVYAVHLLIILNNIFYETNLGRPIQNLLGVEVFYEHVNVENVLILRKGLLYCKGYCHRGG